MVQEVMPRGEVLRCARVHRVGPVLLGVACVAALSAVLGGVRFPVPSLESGAGTVGVPFRRELPLVSAVFLTALWSGPMSAHEQGAADTFHRLRARLLAWTSLAAAVLSLLTEALTVGWPMGLVFVRSLAIWWGLAMLSLRLLGPHLAWVLPLGSAFPLVWFTGGALDWTSAGPGDARFWALAAASLALGTAGLAWTPWHSHALRHRCRRMSRHR
ncbi:hypothetical protein [Streptomyces luteocolor]|uniref:hypothetical protein n=1 Tax=Streptomyces luteocolor TaxID=285500 RepID=UPI001EDB3557|nr:hypothetical protein [Streptomyces luteocolor]